MLKFLIVTFILATTSVAAQDTKNADDPISVPIETCGDLGVDNRPNWCPRPTGDGSFVQGKSECRRVSETSVEYTHCSGGPTEEYSGSDQCCIESRECPGALYAANCIN